MTNLCLTLLITSCELAEDSGNVIDYSKFDKMSEETMKNFVKTKTRLEWSDKTKYELEDLWIAGLVVGYFQYPSEHLDLFIKSSGLGQIKDTDKEELSKYSELEPFESVKEMYLTQDYVEGRCTILINTETGKGYFYHIGTPFPD